MPLALNGTTGVQDNSGAFVQGTAVASTSGTSIDFTSIPSWVKRITVVFNGVSTNSSSNPLVQLGTSSGVTTTGYSAGAIESGSTRASYTTGFGINSGSTSNFLYGSCVINLISGNNWVASHNMVLLQSTTYFQITGAGSVSLAATLDRVRITTVNGTDTFDAGTINILYE